MEEEEYEIYKGMSFLEESRPRLGMYGSLLSIQHFCTDHPIQSAFGLV